MLQYSSDRTAGEPKFTHATYSCSITGFGWRPPTRRDRAQVLVESSQRTSSNGSPGSLQTTLNVPAAASSPRGVQLSSWLASTARDQDTGAPDGCDVFD